MNIVSLIPARGGSKGIPRKNVLPLAGKPMIAWTIEAAMHAKRVSRIVVTTDDAEIANISESFGAEVVKRPDDISGDYASSESAILHALEYLQQIDGYEPDLIVFLQCTSPLTSSEDIDGTIKALLDNNADTALAVTPFHYFLWKKNQDGNATGINHDKSKRLIRQNLQPQFRETGAVYVMRNEGFIKNKHRFFGKTVLYTIPSERVLEIDEPLDLEIADYRLRENQKHEVLSFLPPKIDAIAFDFDGVFTDNKVHVREDGIEYITADRRDGYGIKLLQQTGIPIVVLSSETNPVVKKRCKKLGLNVILAIDKKEQVLKQWINSIGKNLENTVYVGNDLNDLGVMKMVGCPIAVANAHCEIKKIGNLVLDARGGSGAVREICELIVKKWGISKWLMK